MFDAHFHLGVSRIARGICCTATREEWDKIPKERGETLYSIGLLPPSLGGEAVRAFLKRDLTGLEIGEVGLDRRYGGMEEQEAFLSLVLSRAREEKKIVTLHCVREDGRLLSLLDRHVRTIWHGFTGSVESACLAAERGAVISIGPRAKGSRLWRNLSGLSSLPFLIESDAEREEGYASLLETFHGEVARAMGIPREKLEERIDANRAILAY